MPDIQAHEIEEASFDALMAHGAADWVAREMARTIRTAETYGNRICGLYYLESYCKQLASGRVDGRAEPEVSRSRPGVVSVDARSGFAQPAFQRALPMALEAAREVGVASLMICRAHTSTALGYFTETIAKAGFLAFSATNATPIVAAPGGKTRVLGTNPISFAVPNGHGGVRMIFDQSTTTVALGRITMAHAAGQDIPEGWALDAEGASTTQTSAALAGSLTSAGGYKGWGLGLMAEVLVAGLTGSRLSKDIAPLKAPDGAPHGIGTYLLLIDPGIQPGFEATLDALAVAAAQDPGCRMPGQERAPLSTVDVPEALWQGTLALARP